MFCFFPLILILIINNINCYKLEIYANDTIVNKVYTAKIKESLRLNCRLFDGNELNNYKCSLEWKRPKNNIQNNHNRIRPNVETHGASLDILSLQRIDTGQYACICKELNLTARMMLNVKDPLSIPYCGPSMFVCEKSDQCIAQHYVCDGKVDCKYGEDEHIKRCGIDPCNGKIRNCRDGRCIPANWCCNTELDPNCTVKERPSCCRQQFKLNQEQNISDYGEYHSFKSGLLKAAIFTLFVGAVLFFFLVSICLLVLCRIHIHSCPANQDIREVCSRTRIPFYDFYLYLNRNWNNLDHSCVQNRPHLNNTLYNNNNEDEFTNAQTQRLNERTLNSRAIPHGILLMSYNQVQYLPRSASNPPPYSEVCESACLNDPPPPYVSRENLTSNNSQNEQNGYVLVTTQSDDEAEIVRSAEETTSCAIEPTASNSVAVSDSNTSTPRKIDIKKLRQEFLLGATTSTNFSDSETSDFDCSLISTTNFYNDRSKIVNSSPPINKLRETHVKQVVYSPRKHERPRSLKRHPVNDVRPRSLNCDDLLSRRSEHHLVNNSTTASDAQVPLIKYNSGNLNYFSEPDQDDQRTKNDGKLSIRHSIADLSPSGSNEYRYFDIPQYDRETRLLTLPLRESFIGLRKE